ncbi:Protein CBG25172 [Caenorhabditis briggsae]|uniref:Protein CBG25172 n=1 Tax=Caenorhabditis briggsae TaxID=6238 RepID=B6IFZ2_CAEBR|nr:Protein CBG25172 [Caenorhabditis briggsae]CAR98822.1 Protein CBG25172 [Caenorhabditis briggsae]
MSLNTKRLQKPVLPYNVHCKSCTTTLTRQDAQTGKILKIQDEMFHKSCLKCSVCQKE